MPYGESRIVCRDEEIQMLKSFIYGKPEDLRKQHSLCLYGYGGVGKTALVLEALKQIVRDVQDDTTINEYRPQYVLFFTAKQRRLDVAAETGIPLLNYYDAEFRDQLKFTDAAHLSSREESTSIFRNTMVRDAKKACGLK